MSQHPENCSWIYQARRVATQANVGGGAVKVDITLAAGQVGRIIAAYMVNSGTNDQAICIRDEDNALVGYLATATSAASRTSALPSPGNVSATGGNIATSTGMLIPSGAKLSFEQAGAGAQGDTTTIAIILELFNDPTTPTWDKSRSTNAADVTLAASTISAANTLVAGRMWT